MDWEPLWFSKPFELVSTGFLLESPDISFTVKISAVSLQEYSDTSFAPSMARKGYSCQSFYLCPLLNGSRETFFSLHILGCITHWGLSWKRGFCSHAAEGYTSAKQLRSQVCQNQGGAGKTLTNDRGEWICFLSCSGVTLAHSFGCKKWVHESDPSSIRCLGFFMNTDKPIKELP